MQVHACASVHAMPVQIFIYVYLDAIACTRIRYTINAVSCITLWWEKGRGRCLQISLRSIFRLHICAELNFVCPPIHVNQPPRDN